MKLSWVRTESNWVYDFARIELGGCVDRNHSKDDGVRVGLHYIQLSTGCFMLDRGCSTISLLLFSTCSVGNEDL